MCQVVRPDGKGWGFWHVNRFSNQTPTHLLFSPSHPPSHLTSPPQTPPPSPVSALHVHGELHQAAGKAPFVVIPRDNLGKVVVQTDAGLGIKDGRVAVLHKILRHNL